MTEDTKALFEPLALARGPAMKNRFMLAPLTNLQSPDEGMLSQEEHHWLHMRALGGFGMTMTCAATVERGGQGFPGQLGVYEDRHIEPLARLATAIRATGGLSSVQLHHAGARSEKRVVAEPVSASVDEKAGARALNTEEVGELAEAFIAAAERSQAAGFDGVELHGAHGYILAQFLSPTLNRRDDRYGGSLQNRARLTFDIIKGIRQRCRPDFQLGLRISPERFGMQLAEMREFAQEVLDQGEIDYLDLSLWDVAKEPEEEAFKGRSLMSYFTELRRGQVKMGAAGKIMTARQCVEVLEEGCDFVLLGKAAILHHDFPEQVRRNPDFEAIATPVSAEHLAREGLSPVFIKYMRRWENFVEPEAGDELIKKVVVG